MPYAEELDQLLADVPTNDVPSLISQAAKKYGVDEDLARSVAKQESGNDQSQVSRKGALGVMQLMPDTAKDLGVDPNDTAQNIDGGVRYLSQLLKRYKGDRGKALAAYNAGPAYVDSGSPLPKETQDYVRSVAPLSELDSLLGDVPKVGGGAPAAGADLKELDSLLGDVPQIAPGRKTYPPGTPIPKEEIPPAFQDMPESEWPDYLVRMLRGLPPLTPQENQIEPDEDEQEPQPGKPDIMGSVAAFTNTPEFQARQQMSPAERNRQAAIQQATHQQVGVVPVAPQPKPTLVPAPPSTAVPSILAEEPPAAQPKPQGPIMLNVGQARNIAPPTPMAPAPGEAEQAAKDLRNLLLGPAYGAPLRSSGAAESIINALLRASAQFNTPEGIATMAAGAGLARALPELAKSADFVAALAEHPNLSKAVDIVSRNATGIGFGAYGLGSGTPNLVEGVKSGNVEQAAQGALQIGIGAAGLGIAAMNARDILSLYPRGEAPPAEIPVRPATGMKAEVLEAARPEGVETPTTRPNPQAVPEMIAAQQRAQELQQAGQPLSAQQWLRRAEEIQGGLPTQDLTIGSQQFTVRQSGVAKNGRPIYEMLDADGKRVAGGYAGQIRAAVQQRAGEQPTLPSDIQEAIDNAGAFEEAVKELAERYRDILTMQQHLESGEDVQMGGRTMESTTPEQRRQMLADNIQAHQQIYDAAWNSLAKDIGPETAQQLREHVESTGKQAQAAPAAAGPTQPAPAAVTIEAGATYKTPTGEVRVKQHNNGIVLFDRVTPAGVVIPNLRLPLAQFQSMVSAPAPAPSAQVPAAAPAQQSPESPVTPQQPQQPATQAGPEVTTPPPPSEEVIQPNAEGPAAAGPSPAAPQATETAAPESGLPPAPAAETSPTTQNAPSNEGEKPEVRQFSSTQANLPAEVADKATAFGKTIPGAQLAPDGLEATPHITVKYGLHGNDPAEVQRLLANEKPITVTLGRASIFPNVQTDHGTADVLKVDVDSGDLHRLNAMLARELPHTESYPEYFPHVTIAYLKPGQGAQYNGTVIPGVTGKKVTLDTITFSGKDGKQTDIRLGPPKPAGNIPENIPSGTSDLQAQIGQHTARAKQLIEEARKIPGMNSRKAKLLDDAQAETNKAKELQAKLPKAQPAAQTPESPKSTFSPGDRVTITEDGKQLTGRVTNRDRLAGRLIYRVELDGGGIRRVYAENVSAAQPTTKAEKPSTPVVAPQPTAASGFSQNDIDNYTRMVRAHVDDMVREIEAGGRALQHTPHNAHIHAEKLERLIRVGREYGEKLPIPEGEKKGLDSAIRAAEDAVGRLKNPPTPASPPPGLPDPVLRGNVFIDPRPTPPAIVARVSITGNLEIQPPYDRLKSPDLMQLRGVMEWKLKNPQAAAISDAERPPMPYTPPANLQREIIEAEAHLQILRDLHREAEQEGDAIKEEDLIEQIQDGVRNLDNLEAREAKTNPMMAEQPESRRPIPKLVGQSFKRGLLDESADLGGTAAEEYLVDYERWKDGRAKSEPEKPNALREVSIDNDQYPERWLNEAAGEFQRVFDTEVARGIEEIERQNQQEAEAGQEAPGLAEAAGFSAEDIIRQATQAIAQKRGQVSPDAPVPPAAVPPPRVAPRAKTPRKDNQRRRTPLPRQAGPKAPVETAPPTIADAAKAARDRLRAKMKGQQGPATLQARTGPAIDQQDLVDLATIGAEHLLAGTTDFGAWSSRMKEDVGDLVKWIAGQLRQPEDKVLQQVHGYAQAVAKQFAPPEGATIKPEQQNAVQQSAGPEDRAPLGGALPGQGAVSQETGSVPSEGGAGSEESSAGAGGLSGEGTATVSGGGASTPGVQRTAERIEDHAPPRAPNVDTTRHERDYRIPDGRIVSGSPEARARANISAIRLLRKIEEENRPATVDEKPVLAAYVGWGAVPHIFAGNTPEWQALQDELRSLVSDEEYSDAQRSTTNAHFTGDQVVDGIWEGIVWLGARPGMSWLEPAVGIGGFFGRQPEDLLPGSRRIGLDKDSITAKIAKLLYPDSGIDNVAFENAELPKDYFDGAVSNVPFGDFGVYDPEFRTKPFLTNPIHNYFFAKSLTLVRPGGVVAFVTSRYTMDGYDKGHVAFRRWIESQADFLGAVRLPAGAFRQNAGTEVITDIVFLRRKLPTNPGEHVLNPIGATKSWIETESKPYHGMYGQTYHIATNAYYHTHPEMVLGEEGITRGQFSDHDYNVKGVLTKQALIDAIKRIPANQFQEYTPEKKSNAVALTEIGILRAGEIKKGALFFDDKGKLFRKTSAGSAEPLDIAPSVLPRIKGQIGIRDALVRLMQMELQDEPAKNIELARQALNLHYDNFVKAHGLLSSRANQAAMAGDPDAPLLVALEKKYDPQAKTAEKGPIFTKRLLEPPKRIAATGDAKDALSVTLNETGRLDFERMAELTGKTPEEVRQDLMIRGLIFKDPSTKTLQLAEEYLSGSVRAKLEEARRIAKLEPEYDPNVKALESVQPEPIPPSQIRVALGVTWVPMEVYSDFANEVLGRKPEEGYRAQVQYAGGEWHIQNGWGKPARWSTGKVDASRLLLDTFNQRRIKVTYYDSTLKREFTDVAETTAARKKQEELQDYFQEFLFGMDPERADRMAALYNLLNNDLRRRTYDGSHLTFPGMSRLALRNGDLDPHQKGAIWRGIVQPNVLLAHAPGFGKTFEMIAIGMELKRLGLIRRPMYVVPTSTLGGWQEQFAALYPQARVIVFTEKDLEKSKRRETMARIATGDWDAVVVPQSSFKLIRTGDAIFKQNYDRLAAELEEQITEAEDAGLDTRLIKRMEKAKERLLEGLLKKRNAERQDNVINWEQLGIDQLFVDESHNYKKLGFTTKQPNVPGIDQNGNQQTFDLFMKMRHVQQHGRGVTFATGTPITNTMGEMFSIMRYLIEPELQARGLGRFDEWAATFARTVDVFEPKIEGGGYQLKARFAKFVNLPELTQLFASFADVVTPEMVNLPVPTIKGGRQSMLTELSPGQYEYVKVLQKRAESIRKDPRKALPDNMLAVYTDAQKMAMDLRMVQPGAPDESESRLNAAAKNIHRIWKETAGVKGTQLVFADFGKPLSAGGRTFSVYDDLIRKLIKLGIPEKEIAHVYQAKNKLQRDRIFAAVNEGKVRVILGSTDKMGVGVNMQKHAVAEHHLDIPHRPDQLDQREKRVVRQGNQNAEVEMWYYLTRKSLDENKFGNVIRKAKFINQALSSTTKVREAEDIDDAVPSFEMFQAQVSGDPRILRKFQVDSEVDRLGALRYAFNDQKWKQRREINDTQSTNASMRQSIKQMRREIETRDATGRVWIVGKERFEGEGIGKKVAEALKKIDEAHSDKKGNIEEPFVIGSAWGLPLRRGKYGNYFIGNGNVREAQGYDGTVQSLEYHIRNIESDIARYEHTIKENEARVADLETEVDKPWPYQNQLEDLVKEQRELSVALGAEKGDDAALAVQDGEEVADANVEAQEQPEDEEEQGEKEGGESEGPATLQNIMPERSTALESRLSPGFSSQLERTVEAKMPAKASPEQVNAIIKNPQSGVKPDEVKWTGIELWLADQKGKLVTKQEVLDYLKQNAVRVEEVTHGGPIALEWSEAPGNKDILQAQTADTRYEIIYDHGHYSVSAEFLSGDNTGETADLGEFNSWGRAKQEAEKYEGGAIQGNTKYSQYTLPGGQNYRELLLTLPTKAAPKMTLDEYIRDTYTDPSVIYRDPAFLRAATEEYEHWARRPSSLPEGSVYQSGHWSEPNVLAHIRFNDRTGPNGEKILHVEEIQSDWAQAGRKSGYLSSSERAKLERDLKEAQEREMLLMNGPREFTEPRPSISEMREQLAEAHEKKLEIQRKLDRSLPEMPFPKTWPELAFRRALRYAAENGYDQMTWTTGEQQAERYDLSKQIKRVVYEPAGDSTKLWIEDHEGDMLQEQIAERVPGAQWDEKEKAAVVPNSKLPDVIGKELADKMMAGEGESDSGYNVVKEHNGEVVENYYRSQDAHRDASNRTRQSGVKHVVREAPATVKKFEGLDLKVGGEGMKGFYDKILPEYANRYAKKWGAKVGETRLDTADPDLKLDVVAGDGTWNVYREGDREEPLGRFSSFAKANHFAQYEYGWASVHSIDITPAMRESVMQGQPLFAREPVHVPAIPAREGLARPHFQDAKIRSVVGFPLNMDSYWKAAQSQPAMVEGIPVLWVNNAGLDVVAQRIGMIGTGMSSTSTGGMTISTGERRHMLQEAAAAVKAKNRNAFDEALIKIAHQVAQLAPRDQEGPLVIVQAGAHMLTGQVNRILQEELNHARQIAIPQGLRGLPTEPLDTDLGRRAVDSLAAIGYKRPDPKSPFYDHDRAVMAAEVSVRLMHPDLYPELQLTPEQALELGSQFIIGMRDQHGVAAREVTDRLYDTYRQIEGAIPAADRGVAPELPWRTPGTGEGRTGRPPTVPAESVRNPEEPGALESRLSRSGREEVEQQEEPERRSIDDIQRELERQTRKTIGALPLSAPAQKKLSRVLQESRKEIARQLKRPMSGVDWYGEDTAVADADMAKAFPELRKSPSKRIIQKMISAALSPSQNPRQEAFYGAEVYAQYRETGKIPVKQQSGADWPGQGSAVALTKLQKLLDMMGEKGLARFLTTYQDHTKLREIGEHLGYTDRAVRYWLEGRDRVLGAAVLGPKVSRYFAGIVGLPDSGTAVDVWVARAHYRQLGHLSFNGNPIESPLTAVDRQVFMDAHAALGKQFGLTDAQVQSVLWHSEQDLYRSMGAGTKTYKRSDGTLRYLEEKGEHSGYVRRRRVGSGVEPPSGAAQSRSGRVEPDVSGTAGKGIAGKAAEFARSETGTSRVADLVKRTIDRFHDEDTPNRNYSGLGGLKTVLLPGARLAEVEKASQPVFEKALAAGSWQSIASTMTRTGINAINQALKGTENNWIQMRAMLTQDRLDALRDRWNEFARMFEFATKPQLQELIEANGEGGQSFFLGLLSNIEGRNGLGQDLGQTAAALLEHGNLDELRDLMVQTFTDASAAVANLMSPEEFNALTDFFENDPRGKAAIEIYRNEIEHPLERIHRENEGVMGPKGKRFQLYIPLVAFEPKPPVAGGRRLPLHKPKNPNNNFATGLSSSYDIGMPGFIDAIARSVRANKRALLVQTLRDEGWSQPKPDGWDGRFIGPDGVTYKGVAQQVSDARTLIKDGKVIHIPGRQDILPEFLWKGLKPMLQKDPIDQNDLFRMAHFLNGLALKATPAELVYHSAGLLGAINANTPFIGKTGLDKFLSAPVLRAFAINAKLLAMNPESPENIKKLREMAEAGALPGKMGKVTFDKKFAEEYGVKREISFGPFLFGPRGVDVRARILMYDIFKAAYPNGSKADLYNFVNQLGNYTPEFQGEIERFLKRVGIGPFATAGMTRAVNAFHAWTGTGPGSGKNRILQMFFGGGAIAALAIWVLAYHYLTGKWPTQDKRAKLFQIPVGGGHGRIDQYRHSKIGNLLWGKGNEVGYLNLGAFFPLVARGARLLGFTNAFQVHQLGGNQRQITDAMELDAINSLLHPAEGPALTAAWIGVTGTDLYANKLHEGEKPAFGFMPAYPDERKPGFLGGLAPALVNRPEQKHSGIASERGAKTARVLGALNGFYQNIGEGTGMLGPDSGMKGAWYVRLPLDMLMPGVVKNASNPYAKAEVLRKQRAGEK